MKNISQTYSVGLWLFSGKANMKSILTATVVPSPRGILKSAAFGIALLATIGLAAPGKAANPQHIKQLLQTRRCQGCDLRAANLANVDLSQANLTGADLSGANLSNAKLNGSELPASNLKQANLRGAQLNSVNLAGANLTSANLTKAVLTNTNLSGANLHNTNLSQTNLNSRTNFPHQQPVVVPIDPD